LRAADAQWILRVLRRGALDGGWTDSPQRFPAMAAALCISRHTALLARAYTAVPGCAVATTTINRQEAHQMSFLSCSTLVVVVAAVVVVRPALHPKQSASPSGPFGRWKRRAAVRHCKRPLRWRRLAQLRRVQAELIGSGVIAVLDRNSRRMEEGCEVAERMGGAGDVHHENAKRWYGTSRRRIEVGLGWYKTQRTSQTVRMQWSTKTTSQRSEEIYLFQRTERVGSTRYHDRGSSRLETIGPIGPVQAR
jgi:hypothetical protein